jgi:hypothetical protein
MPLVIFLTVRNDDLSASLGYYAPASTTVGLSPESAGKPKRTELGDEIASEKTRAAKHRRNVPCDRATPRRTVRDDRWSVGQGKQVVQSALKNLRKSALAI